MHTPEVGAAVFLDPAAHLVDVLGVAALVVGVVVEVARPVLERPHPERVPRHEHPRASGEPWREALRLRVGLDVVHREVAEVGAERVAVVVELLDRLVRGVVAELTHLRDRRRVATRCTTNRHGDIATGVVDDVQVAPPVEDRRVADTAFPWIGLDGVAV